jgi:D-alanyl-D-alanine carboxypeptidase
MNRLKFLIIVLAINGFATFSCVSVNNLRGNSSETADKIAEKIDFSPYFSTALTNAQLPEKISEKIQENITANPDFANELHVIMQTDPYLWMLVDREHSLNEDYEPHDLIELKDNSYHVSREGLLIRSAAAEALEEMSAAAKEDGLTLTASSCYRSYAYQVEVFARNAKELGQQIAARRTARPGHSQHQLGLTVDFGSMTYAFARTAQSRWLTANASRFGWSMSYPQGYENVTGYSYECWHYRYVGKELAQFIDNYFDGIQHYALKFLHELKTARN